MGGGGGGGEGASNFISSWFSLNNPERVKAATLTFCSIQEHFIRDICVKFGIRNLPQSLDIGENSDGGIFDFMVLVISSKGKVVITVEPVMTLT